MPLIKLNKIRKTFKTSSNFIVAVNDVDLSIENGEYTAIMGTSGSGKSTLLNIIGLLDNFDAGNYFIEDKEVSNLTDSQSAKYRRETFGFIFQSFNLMPHRTALENVALPLFYQGIPSKKRNEKARYYLNKLGIATRENHLPGELSGGQKQRVAIARALITEPKVILADEPTGALDSKTSTETMELLANINNDGQTIILVTHDKEVANFANRKIEFIDGCIKNDYKKIQLNDKYNPKILRVS